MATALANRLRRLEAIREAANRLMNRPQLQRDIFPRGNPEAIAEIRQAFENSGGDPRMAAALGYTYAVSGRRADAEKILMQLAEQSKHRYVAPYDIAAVHIGLGNKSQAFDYLERAFDDHSSWLIFMRADPRFDSIRSDPRYQELLRRMHLIP